MEEVAEYARKKKISKNKVIEIALKKLLDEEIRNELMESFKKIPSDPDMIEMAEWGMVDYAEQLAKYDIRSKEKFGMQIWSQPREVSNLVKGR